MAKSSTLRVLSRAHMPIVLQEPMPNPEKPGDAPPLRTVTLGAHPHGHGAVTELTGDEVEVFHKWMKANPNHAFIHNKVFEEVGDDYEMPGARFGHELILEDYKKDKGAVKAAREGSAVTEPGPVPPDALTPTTNSPPDDSPGGEPRHASQPGEPEPERTGRRPGRPPRDA